MIFEPKISYVEHCKTQDQDLMYALYKHYFLKGAYDVSKNLQNPLIEVCYHALHNTPIEGACECSTCI